MKQSHGSMLALFVLTGCWFALGSSRPARANADEPSATPALDACQRLATLRYRQVSQSFVSVRLLEEGVKQEKYETKVGSQAVSTVLSGHGVWQDKTGGPSNVRFVCLLENPEKALFVDIGEDGRRDPVDVCWDAFEPSGWGKMTECLQASLKREEAALADALSKAAQQAGQSLDKISAKKTLQESNAQWVKYRDTECARRQAAVAGRNHPDIGELTCLIQKTAERISDLKFDD